MISAEPAVYKLSSPQWQTSTTTVELNRKQKLHCLQSTPSPGTDSKVLQTGHCLVTDNRNSTAFNPHHPLGQTARSYRQVTVWSQTTETPLPLIHTIPWDRQQGPTDRSPSGHRQTGHWTTSTHHSICQGSVQSSGYVVLWLHYLKPGITNIYSILRTRAQTHTHTHTNTHTLTDY